MRHKKHRGGVVAGILLPMGLTCLFALCSLALALIGGQAYKDIQAQVEDSHDTTVAASYLHTKLSQTATAGAVTVREQDGAELLVITAEVNGAAYETRIFLADTESGPRLVETFGSADLPLDTASANTIASISRCSFSLDEAGLFSAELESAAGTVTRTAFALLQGGRL